MTTTIRLAAMACAVAWLVPASAALRMAPVDSIGWVVFDTDVIVRGTVVEAIHSTGPGFVYSTVKVNDAVERWAAGEQLFFLMNTAQYMKGRQPTPQQAAVFTAHSLTDGAKRVVSLSDRADRQAFGQGIQRRASRPGHADGDPGRRAAGSPAAAHGAVRAARDLHFNRERILLAKSAGACGVPEPVGGRAGRSAGAAVGEIGRPVGPVERRVAAQPLPAAGARRAADSPAGGPVQGGRELAGTGGLGLVRRRGQMAAGGGGGRD